jgi:hypothetical protein
MINYYYPVIIIIVLFVLPLLLSISTLYLSNVYLFFKKYFNDGYLGVNLVYILQYAIFFVMLLIYPMWTLIYPTAKYFKIISNNNVVLEYETLKKIAYILFPLFLFGTFHLITAQIMHKNPLLDLIDLPQSVSIMLSILVGVSFFIVASVLFKLLLLNVKKDFGFYFAKACICDISKNEKDEANKIRFMIKGLNKYNTFLRRYTGIYINSLKNIYSKILSDPNCDNNKAISELIFLFENDDRLKPIKYLSQILNVRDDEHFLVKEPLRKRIETWVTIAGTMISALTAMISGLTVFVPKH